MPSINRNQVENRSPSIFIGFSEVANFYNNLLKGFHKNGVYPKFMTWGQNIRGYGNSDSETLDQKLLHYLSKGASKGKSRFLFIPVFWIYRVLLLMVAIFKYDVFLFSYKSSFLGTYDLPLLKLFGKKIFYFCHGSDARPPYINGNNINTGLSLEDVYLLTNSMKKKLSRIEKYATGIISSPPFSQFLNKSVIHFLWVGLPFELMDELEKQHNAPPSPKVRVLHAPSVRKSKGSDIFKEIIMELIQEGEKIEYKELFNVENAEVIEALKHTDILLDEMYSDTCLAGLATEAAFFGVPTLVSGYYSDMAEDFNYNKLPPSMYVYPEDIKESLRFLVKNKNVREELGNSAKEFVRDTWSPKKVASRILAIISGEIPIEATFNPTNITYYKGWGVSKSDLHSFLADYLRVYGEEGLFLEHNLDLLKKIKLFTLEK